MMAEALESAIRYVRTKLMNEMAESDDKTEGIACRGLIPAYIQNKQHEVGEVATHSETGHPRECIQAYDGTVQQDWTIDTPTLWKPLGVHICA